MIFCLSSLFPNRRSIEFEFDRQRDGCKICFVLWLTFIEYKTDLFLFRQIIRGGGVVVGRVDEEGRLSGNKVILLLIQKKIGKSLAHYKFLQIAYVYPDFKTALLGTFQEGQLVSAQEAELTGSLLDYGCIQVPIFSDPKGGSYTREISTFDFVTSAPMLRDPYESRTVEVRQSRWKTKDLRSVLILDLQGSRCWRRPFLPVCSFTKHSPCILQWDQVEGWRGRSKQVRLKNFTTYPLGMNLVDSHSPGWPGMRTVTRSLTQAEFQMGRLTSRSRCKQ